MFEPILIASFLVGLILIAILSIATTMYLIINTKRQSLIEKDMRRLHRNNQPKVTVLMYTHNQSDIVISAVKQLKKSRYHKFDIVVVDDASSDGTGRVIRRYARKSKKGSLRVLQRRKSSSFSATLLAGYKKSQRGSLVIIVTPQTIIDPYLIKRAVATWRVNPNWKVQSVGGLKRSDGLVGITRQLESILWQGIDSLKVLTLSSARQPAGTVFLTLKHNKLLRRVFISGVIVTLFCVGFLIYGVISVFYVWLLIVIFSLLRILQAPDENRRTRLELSYATPSLPFLIPALGFVEIFLFASKKIAKL